MALVLKRDGTTSIGLTWFPDGTCVAVRLERSASGQAAVLQSSAIRKAGTPDRIADVLNSLFAEVGGQPSDILVAGPSGPAVLEEVSLPNSTSRRDIAKLLEHELRFKSPVDTAFLHWGYRELDISGATERNVRLCYTQKGEYQRWLNIGRQLGAVDAFMPSEMALSGAEFRARLPWISQAPFHHEIVKNESGRLSVVAAAGEAPAVDKVEYAGITFSTEQTTFLPAVVLAVYGLRNPLDRDRKSMGFQPHELVKRRHRLSRAVVAFLFMIAILLGVALGTKKAKSAVVRLGDLNRAKAELESRADTLRAQIEELEQRRDRMNEMRTAGFNLPSLWKCLAVIGEKAPDGVWISRLKWDKGQIDLELRSRHRFSVDDLLQELKTTPMFNAVGVGRQTTARDGQMTVGIQVSVSP